MPLLFFYGILFLDSSLSHTWRTSESFIISHMFKSGSLWLDRLSESTSLDQTDFLFSVSIDCCNSLPRGRALQEFPHLHWHAVWFCISKGNTEFPLSKYGVVLGYFTGDFCQAEEVCFYSYFLNISSLGFVNRERLLDFVTCLFLHIFR